MGHPPTALACNSKAMMTTETQLFGTFLNEHLDDGLDRLIDQLKSIGEHYQAMPQSDLRQALRQSLQHIADSLVHDDRTALTIYTQALSQQRAAANFTLGEAIAALDLFRLHVLDRLDVFRQDGPSWSLTAQRQLEDVLRVFGNYFLSGFDTVLQQARAELHLQTEQLEAQRRTIRDLSTPILPVYEGIIVVPLVGVIDSYRATQIMEHLLQAITDYQSDIVIVDITGVPVVDASVMNYLLQTARAVRLVGAQIVLVGISADVAQTIVQLGADLSHIATLANLQESLQYALQQMRKQII